MDSRARIGVDFDNTIVDYSDLFIEAGAASGFTPETRDDAKNAVREYIRSTQGENVWQELQAQTYGANLRRAPAYPGFATFLRGARERGASVFIVSHKGLRAAADSVDLHEAARQWILSQGIEVDGVYFEPTRHSKLRRIETLKCTHFIDDLPDVLEDAAFPRGVSRILFAPAGGPRSSAYTVYRSWTELANEFVRAAV